MTAAVILLTLAMIAIAALCLVRVRVTEAENDSMRQAVINLEQRLVNCENLAVENAHRLDTSDFRFSDIERISAETLHQCENYKNYIYRYYPEAHDEGKTSV